MVAIVPRSCDQYLLGVHKVGEPRVPKGIQFQLERVIEYNGPWVMKLYCTVQIWRDYIIPFVTRASQDGQVTEVHLEG